MMDPKLKTGKIGLMLIVVALLFCMLTAETRAAELFPLGDYFVVDLSDQYTASYVDVMAMFVVESLTDKEEFYFIDNIEFEGFSQKDLEDFFEDASEDRTSYGYKLNGSAHQEDGYRWVPVLRKYSDVDEWYNAVFAYYDMHLVRINYFMNNEDLMYSFMKYIHPTGWQGNTSDETGDEKQSFSENMTVGDIITFGRYEQNNNLKDGPEPVEWQVLTVNNNRALLLSRYGLDVQPYSEEKVDVTWETSFLRNWLHEDFFNDIFTDSEQALIPEVVNNNPDNKTYRTNGGNSTRDRIFLLSSDEVEEYFTNNEERKLIITNYTNAKEHLTSKGSSGDTFFWWLRSPGVKKSSAAVTFNNGHIELIGSEVDYKNVVRPAFWLDLEKYYSFLLENDGKPAGNENTENDSAGTTGVVTVNGLYYKGPSKDSRLAGIMLQGTEVFVLDHEITDGVGWYLIQDKESGTTGWMEESSILVSEPTQNTSADDTQAVVVKVGNDVITVGDYQSAVRMQRQNINSNYQYMESLYAMFGMEMDESTKESYALQMSEEYKVLLGQNVLANMVDQRVMAYAAAEEGITVSDEEVEAYYQNMFSYYPNGTPTPAPTAIPFEATPTVTDEQLAVLQFTKTPASEEPEVKATPIAEKETDPKPTSVPTMGPTPTPYTEEMFNMYETYYFENTAPYYSKDFFKNALRYELLENKVRKEIEDEVSRTADMVWARHILVATEKEALDALERIQNGERWGDVAAEVTLDSSENGGDLGWFTEGVMVQPFNDAAFSQEVGTISDPVWTDFGWHLIQVVAHEEHPFTRNEFEDAVDKAYENWLEGYKKRLEIDIKMDLKDITPVEPAFAGS